MYQQLCKTLSLSIYFQLTKFCVPFLTINKINFSKNKLNFTFEIWILIY